MRASLPRIDLDALSALQRANRLMAVEAAKVLLSCVLPQIERRPSSGVQTDAVIKKSGAKATTAAALRFGVTVGPRTATSLTEVVKQWFPEGANLDEGLATCR